MIKIVAMATTGTISLNTCWHCHIQFRILNLRSLKTRRKDVFTPLLVDYENIQNVKNVSTVVSTDRYMSTSTF